MKLSILCFLIILINFLIPLKATFNRNLQETTTDNGTTNQNSSDTTSDSKSEIEIIGSQANYETIPNIIISIEAISSTYNLIFENLPEEQTGKETSTLDDIQQGLETYKKVRNFVVVLSSRREELLEDIDYISKNVGNLGLSKYEVLAFYDLRTTYELLLKNIRAYEPGFQLKDAFMDLEVKEYLTDIEVIVAGLKKISTAEQLVWEKTKFIRDQIEEEDTSSAVLNSIDAVLMLMLDLLVYRKEVIAELNIIRPSLLDLEYKRERFIQILTDESIYVGIKTTKNQNANTNMLNILIICFVFVLF